MPHATFLWIIRRSVEIYTKSKLALDNNGLLLRRDRICFDRDVALEIFLGILRFFLRFLSAADVHSEVAGRVSSKRVLRAY